MKKVGKKDVQRNNRDVVERKKNGLVMTLDSDEEVLQFNHEEEEEEEESSEGDEANKEFFDGIYNSSPFQVFFSLFLFLFRNSLIFD